MLKSQVKLGDNVFCIKSYIETEFGRSYRKYANENNFLVHLTKGQQYKVADIVSNAKAILLDKDEDIDRLLVKNDFGQYQWYNISSFDKIKEMRRQKLLKILNNGTTDL